MSLQSAYGNVRKGSVIPGPNFCSSGSAPVVQERDPKFIALENSVFGQINDILNKLNPIAPIEPVQSTSFISVEQALKELRDMGGL